MMNFIVLGIIPGTHIQLNFTAVLPLIAGIATFTWIETRRLRQARMLNHRRNFDVISLRSLEQA